MNLTFYADSGASVACRLGHEPRGARLRDTLCGLLTGWALDTLDDPVRIELWSIIATVSSDSVPRRPGFSEEGVLRSRPVPGGYRDVRCVSLLRGVVAAGLPTTGRDALANASGAP